MGGLGVILAIVLAIADKKLYVWEDPRIDEVEAMLPHANCGACGCPGCRAFAEKAVHGEIEPGKCTVNSPEGVQKIARYLNVAAGTQEKRVARLACAGGAHVSRMRAHYAGITSCRAAALVAGGGRGCSWGCLGLADCAAVCEFDAIHMDANGLPVVATANCTACGDCVDVCPKNLFSIHPVSHRLWVACNNRLNGDIAEAECEVACTACGRCAVDAPGLISIRDNLAVIDYTKNSKATQVPIQRCPTGAIVWLDDVKGPIKGPDAKKITRKSPLPVELAGLPISHPPFFSPPLSNPPKGPTEVRRS
ncbi:MAG: RnfABCDGE type electron transport complex subunit B [Acidobacteriota bacterium]|nr:RnfABCDGE type electron transport complex subunit B [Acidobacteriota bacterium]